MAPLLPFEDLRTRLRAAGVPPRRVQRLIAELSDHLRELTDEGIARGEPTGDAANRARRLLGDDRLIERLVLADRRNLARARRHPALWFGAMPIPAMCLGLAAYGLAAWGSVSLMRSAAAVEPDGMAFRLMATALYVIAAYAIIPAEAAALCALARRASVGLGWPLLSCCLLATAGALLVLQVQLPTSFGGPGTVTLGLSWAVASWVRLLGPLAIFAAFVMYSKHQVERERTLSCGTHRS
jgi:hypothetical protein